MPGDDPNADSFNEPQSTETTYTYPDPTYTHPNTTYTQLQGTLSKQRGKKQRDPSSLARMISNARRARPSSFKNG